MNSDMVRQSRIRRLYGRRLARRMGGASGAAATELAKLAEQEASYEIARQQAKGWKLVTRLETGEGVFVRDDGSYVRIGRKFGGDPDHNITLTGYAVDAGRFRLGYS